MTKNTLTTIGNLKPGDIFSRPGYAMKFMKIAAQPVKKYKMIFECSALPMGKCEPQLFKASTEVVYLFTSVNVMQ
jgi:hypothetical protein